MRIAFVCPAHIIAVKTIKSFVTGGVKLDVGITT